MAGQRRLDHFEKNAHQLGMGKVDWNINITLDDIAGEDREDVIDEARRLQELVVDPYPERFHSRIPARWLHVTIERVGTIQDFTPREMKMGVAELLGKQLKNVDPVEAEITGWWQPERAIPMLDIKPKNRLRNIRALLLDAMAETFGEERAATLLGEPFDAHMALAYARTYDRTEETDGIYANTAVEPVKFVVNSLSLVLQHLDHPEHPGHYEWIAVKRIPLGR